MGGTRERNAIAEKSVFAKFGLRPEEKFSEWAARLSDDDLVEAGHLLVKSHHYVDKICLSWVTKEIEIRCFQMATPLTTSVQ